jgi:hypothetical protein
MTHEAMLVEATIGTRNGYGEVTIGAALGVAPAVRLTFAGRHAPSVTFEYVEPRMLRASGEHSSGPCAPRVHRSAPGPDSQ